MRRLFLVLLILCVPAIRAQKRVGPYEWTDVDRIVAIGDVHGSHGKLTHLLEGLRVIDEAGNWIGRKTHLVLVGDTIDRGRDDRAVLDLLRRLQPQAEEAGGRVHVLLGNHEVMNLVRDLRYVHPDGYSDFAAEENEKQRSVAFKRFARRFKGRKAKAPQAFAEAFPPGYFARIEAFNPEGEYGKWLLEQPILIKVNDALFVHGGLTEQFAAFGIDGINEQVLDELERHLSVRKRLEGRSIVTNLMTFKEAQYAVGDFFDRNRLSLAARTWVEAAADFGRLPDSEWFGVEGPLWYRGNSLEDERIEGDRLERTLELLSAGMIVVAHSPTGGKRITSRFGGRLYRIDHGMAYGSRPLALVLEDRMALVYDPGEEALSEPRPELPQGEGLFARLGELSDEHVAELLARGKIVSMRELGRGSTRPKLVEIHDGETRMRAIFKSVDERPGALHDGSALDRYRQEIAAYRVDRLLGLGFVPVTVMRKVDGVEGSMQQWVEGAVDGESLKGYDLRASDPERMKRASAIGLAFEFLIGNSSRSEADLLYLLEENRVMCVDHSRSFPTGSIEERFPSAVDGKFLDSLREIDNGRLNSALGELLSKGQIEALLRRRDEILDHYREESHSGPSWPLKLETLTGTPVRYAQAPQAAAAEADEPQAWSAEKKESFLLNSTITATKYIGEGVTRPKKVTLEMDGVTLNSAFKYHDEFRPGVTQFDAGPREVNFRDSYLFDRAAYLLDRELGMNMVPPTVLREIDGQDGALVWWIPDSISEVDRIQRRIMPGRPESLFHQQDVAKLFYALVQNTDENLQNQLITTLDWKLHLIDFTRAFRFSKNLSKDFRKEQVTLPRAFHQRLQALQEDRLLTVMDGLLSKAHVRAMLARRDALLDKIETDIQAHGEQAVFQD